MVQLKYGITVKHKTEPKVIKGKKTFGSRLSLTTPLLKLIRERFRYARKYANHLYVVLVGNRIVITDDLVWTRTNDPENVMELLCTGSCQEYLRRYTDSNGIAKSIANTVRDRSSKSYIYQITQLSLAFTAFTGQGNNRSTWIVLDIQ